MIGDKRSVSVLDFGSGFLKGRQRLVRPVPLPKDVLAVVGQVATLALAGRGQAQVPVHAETEGHLTGHGRCHRQIAIIFHPQQTAQEVLRTARVEQDIVLRVHADIVGSHIPRHDRAWQAIIRTSGKPACLRAVSQLWKIDT